VCQPFRITCQLMHEQSSQVWGNYFLAVLVGTDHDALVTVRRKGETARARPAKPKPRSGRTAQERRPRRVIIVDLGGLFKIGGTLPEIKNLFWGVEAMSADLDRRQFALFVLSVMGGP